ncbi:MAG: peptidyl-prolyl cis-trans isomerase [Rhodospirillaceae bacterium]|nr:peptidyl-prolyl cis-trans isomerase [Rhodospirillaceae bacterium]
MIEFFRTSVKESLLFKIFLGLLMASFGIWGVGDFMGGGSLTPGTAIKVGDSEVKTSVLQRRFDQDMERFREATGGADIPPEIMKRTVMETTLDGLKKSATFDEAARDVGIIVSAEQLRKTVYEFKSFHEDGKFNRMKFEQLLAQNNLSESAYLKMLESDLHQITLMQPIMVNAAAPDYLVNSLFQFRSETRIADTLLISNASMALQAVPKDEDLKAVYDKNIATFTAPEYRKLTILTLSTADLVTADNIADEQAKTYYDENTVRYRTPETKRLSQLVFDTKEKAEAVRAQAAAGESLQALAAKSKSGAPIDLGQLAANSPLVKTLGADAFNTPVGEISQPVQTPLGWHLVQVISVTPETTQPFEAVKDVIKQTIAADKGADAVYDASVQLEDGLAAGTPLADIAKNVGGRITQIAAVDQSGQDPNGVNVPNTIDPKNLWKVAFETPVNKDSKLADLPSRDGYYVVHVDAITPPTPKPLLEVRSKVAALWESEQKQAQAQALADKLAKDIGPSSQLSAIEAQDKRVSYAPLGPITRFGEGPDRKNVVDAKRVSPDLLDRLFKAKVGEVVVAPVQDGFVVARLKEVAGATPTGTQAEVQKQLRESIRNDIGSNLMDQVYKAFANRYPVEVDRTIIDNITATR